MKESSTEDKTLIKKAKKENIALKKKLKALLKANKIAAKKLVVTDNVLKDYLESDSLQNVGEVLQ